MTDLVITAANVVAGPNAVKETGTAGETITAGMPVYKDAASKRFMKAKSTSAVPGASIAYGVALHASLLYQPLTVQKSGDITIGATLTAGSAYYLSETPGGIEPVADLAAGENVCVLGFAKSTTVLALDISNPATL
jgi:hypothetical protein